MTRIIAYAFEADVHCPACTALAHQRSSIRFQLRPESVAGRRDEHGLPETMMDREGNPVHPIFSTDEQLEPLFCGDCHERISQ